MKSILNKIILLLFIIGIVFTLFKFNVFHNIFSSTPVVIDETPVLVKEIKNIAELFSVCFYDEVVVTASKKEETSVNKATKLVGNLFGKTIKDSTDRRLILIIKGRTYAGIDLSGLSEQSINKKDSLTIINIPQPKIIDVVVNPTDVSVFSEEGNWTNEEVTNLKLKAKELLKEKAIMNGIIEKSKTKSEHTLESLFTLNGDKNIHVNIQ